jgi:4-amino-4-deoxy-L-arabinose transferase-like glycosyltransferase
VTASRLLPHIALAIVLLAYAHNTLPYLTMLPRVNVDEPWLMERAYQVLTDGIPNQPMLRLERPYFLQVGYDYLYAPWFAAFGVGMYQARLLSVLLGCGALLSVYGIGRRLLSAEVGVLAAALLAADSNFLGNARTSRTDMPSVFFAVLALYCFLHARDRGGRSGHVLAGAAAGLAMLCHGNAYWVVIVLTAWYAITYGLRGLLRSPIYWCALGGTITFGPYLAIVAAHWAEVQVQIGNFAGDRAPSLAPGVIYGHLQREIERYRGWYFGLITNAVPNPLLLVFQITAAIGVVYCAVRAVIPSPQRAAYALLTTFAVGSVVIFAGFIPNKAHVYMPNVLVGLSLAAAAVLVGVVTRITARGAVIALALTMLYSATSVAYYERWYNSQRKSELTSYEAVERAIEALVPPGPKDVFASPNLWVPFHADDGVRFLAYTGATPRADDDGFVLDGFGNGKPIYLLVDESEWKTVATDPAGGYTQAWRDSWGGFITTQCALRGVAYGTSYGNLASYECGNDTKPPASEPFIIGDGRRFRIGDAIWAPTAEELAALPRYDDPRRSATAPRPEVDVVGNAVRIAGREWPGVETHLAVVPGERYLLTADVESAGPGDIAFLGRWDDPQVTTLFGAGAAGLFLPLAETPWFPGDRAFVATAPRVWLRIYSEAPSADFRVRSIVLRALEPLE